MSTYILRKALQAAARAGSRVRAFLGARSDKRSRRKNRRLYSQAFTVRQYDRQGITAVTNGFLRTNRLAQQLQALRSQTIVPQEILHWSNYHPRAPRVSYHTLGTVNSLCNRNLGVWARFAFALMAPTKYVCIFDDDTIPGTRWFENCLETMRQCRGLLGTNGMVWERPDSYDWERGHCWRNVGWHNPNSTIEQVDIVGHCWFFEKEWLSAFWREMSIDNWTTCGEDIHFSFMLQKYLGINTFVPPHPPDDRSLWGSVHGYEFGIVDECALYKKPGQASDANEFFQRCRAQGWKLLCDARRT